MVAGLLLSRVAWIVRRANVLKKSASVVSDEALMLELVVAAVEQQVPKPLPEVRVSETALVPMTVDRVVLLPAGWREWDPFMLHAVLSHELAHIRRRDWMTSLAAAVNRAVFWFHPLSWWVERRLMGLAEEACDAAAIGATGDAHKYAQTVLNFAAVMSGAGSRLNWAATAMARSSRVGQRIERILEGEVNTSRQMTRAAWAALVLLAVPILYAAAALHVARQEVLGMPAVELPVAAAPAVGMPQQTGLQVQVQAPPPIKVAPYQREAGVSGAPIPGATTSSAQVPELEARVKKNPHDLDARAQLVGYYFLNALAEQFRAQVLWLAENHPESNVHETYPLSTIDPRNPLLDSTIYERLRSTWQRKAAENPANIDILLHAAAFFRSSDVETAERLAMDARTVNPGDKRPLSLLISLYMSALTAPALPRLQGNAQRMLSNLESSRDAELLGQLGSLIKTFDIRSMQGQMPSEMNERIQEMNRIRREASLRLLERAVAVDPGNSRWVQALEDVRAGRNVETLNIVQPSEPMPPNRISVGGNVQAAMLVSKVDPEYPALARQARISGTIRFTAIIGKEGDVINLTLVSGHPLLVQAATAAAKQYRYKPTLLNGQPVEVVTQVDVNFTLNEQ